MSADSMTFDEVVAATGVGDRYSVAAWLVTMVRKMDVDAYPGLTFPLGDYVSACASTTWRRKHVERWLAEAVAVVLRGRGESRLDDVVEAAKVPWHEWRGRGG